MNRGFVKLYRKMLDWEWYSDTNVVRLFLHLLLIANHKDKPHKGKVIKRGQVATGRHKLALETNLTPRNVRTALEKLKTTNEVTIETSREGSIISITNYDLYHCSDQPSDQQNDQRPTNKTTNKTTNEVTNDQFDKSSTISTTLLDLCEPSDQPSDQQSASKTTTNKKNKKNIYRRHSYHYEIMDYYNSFKKQCSLINDERCKMIDRVIGEGFTVKDIKMVIASKSKDEYFVKNKYFTLETLLRKCNFPKYIEAAREDELIKKDGEEKPSVFDLRLQKLNRADDEEEVW